MQLALTMLAFPGMILAEVPAAKAADQILKLVENEQAKASYPPLGARH